MFYYLCKVTFFQINLSHNLLTYVPANLPILLSQIVQLDLSKNQLVKTTPVFTLDSYQNVV
jgi:Leucine-rich repeat (LRR) protein